jgi:hypothetical protein
VQLLGCAMVEVFYQYSSVCLCPTEGRVFHVMWFGTCAMYSVGCGFINLS